MKATDNIFAYNQQEQMLLSKKMEEIAALFEGISKVLGAQPASLKEFEDKALPLPIFADLMVKGQNLQKFEGSLAECTEQLLSIQEDFLERIDQNPYKVLANPRIFRNAINCFELIRGNLISFAETQ